MRELLGLLDERLQRRGVAASVYVVGGVAVALQHRDVNDIKALATALHLEDVLLEDLRDVVAEVYGSSEALATAIRGPDHDAGDELLVLCQRVALLLRAASSTHALVVSTRTSARTFRTSA